MSTRTRKWILISIAIVLLVLVIGYASLRCWIIQEFSDPYLAVYRSPTGVDAEIWLVNEGFQDRGIMLHVKTSGTSAPHVTALDCDGLYSFSHLQWTKDGQVAVFALRIFEEDYPTVYAFAYDFSKSEPTYPPWNSAGTTSRKPAVLWEKHERKVLALANSHGGLQADICDRESVDRESNSVWFWQVP